MYNYCQITRQRFTFHILVAMAFVCLGFPNGVLAQSLEHRYSFDAADNSTNVIDSIGGTNWSGTLEGNAYITNDTVVLPFTPGSTSASPAGYVQLPNGIITNDASITVECWLTDFEGQTWAEAWSFGDSDAGPGNPPGGGTSYLALVPTSGANGFGPVDYRAGFNLTNGPGEEDIIDSSGKTIPTNVEVYSVVTYDLATSTGTLYLNGVQVGQSTITNIFSPTNLGATFNNWIGRDQFGSDPTFAGSVNELRIWNGAVSPLYVAVSEAVGPETIVTNLKPSEVTITLTNASMVAAATQQAIVTANFEGASNVLVPGSVAQLTSSDTNVLTVTSNGLVTAITGGTATISANVGGTLATSAPILVSLTKPTIVQGPTAFTGFLGQTADLTVSALGGQLTYQWSVDSTPIAGATNSSLILSNLVLTNAGTYSVIVSNSLGSTNSSPIILSIGNPALVHRWSFDESAGSLTDVDSVGGADGTNMNDAALDGSGSVQLPNDGIVSDNPNAPYVQFPPGIMTNLNSISIETWFTDTAGLTWAEVWSFGGSTTAIDTGNDQTNYIGLIPHSGPNDFRAAFKNTGEQDVIGPANTPVPLNTEQYAVLTYDNTTTTAKLYLNGALVGVNTNVTITPASLGNTYDNWIGRDQFPDSAFAGSVDELRIWNSAVSPLYQALTLAAGPEVVITNTRPISITASVTNSTLLGGQTVQLSLAGSFPQLTNATLGASIGTFASSDTNVVTIDSNGVITAVGPGSATVTATVDGVTGNVTITVPAVPPTISQQPVSLSLYAGQAASFTVGAVGSALSYQWSQGTSDLSGQTNSSLVLTNVTSAQNGTYTVKVSNNSGSTNASATLTVIEPSLVHRWSFNDATNSPTDLDSVGGADGTNFNGAALDGSGEVQLPVSGLTSDNPGAPYVQLPAGIMTNLNSITIETWFTDNGGLTWAEVWSFGGSTTAIDNGNDQTNYIGLVPHSGPDDFRAAFKTTTEQDVIGPASTPIPTNTEVDAVLTYDNTTTTGKLYLNGALVGVNTNVTITPADLGNTFDNWIGRDQFPDAAFVGNVDELRIYAGPLTATDIQNNHASGPNTLVAPGSANKTAVTITQSGPNVTISWQSGVLLQAPTLLGPWTTNSATPPFTTPATNTSEFYKVLLNP
ncbi:MAG TPA: LamG-like jellyroll fold domain-containing protein [Verrucomicrobiae bacterium]|jgi:hypothetical protein